MKRIDDYSVHDDLPESLNRLNAKELAELWDKAQLKFIDSQILRILIYPVIDQLPGELVDALAVQLHCDFYDKSLSLKARRQIVKTSIAWHRIKGTPAAVEMLTQTIFHESYTKEWFGYGGKPYFFRMVQNISDGAEDVTPKTLAQLKKAIWMGKNVRSWLELLEFVYNMEDDEGANTWDALFPITALGYEDWYIYGRNRMDIPQLNGVHRFGSPAFMNGILQMNGGSTFNGVLPGAIPFYGAEDFAHDLISASAVTALSERSEVREHFGYGIGMEFSDHGKAEDGSGNLGICIGLPMNGTAFMNGAWQMRPMCRSDALDGDLSVRHVRCDGKWRLDGEIRFGQTVVVA